ncbi:MAG: orotidine-5'-phosphate decarboxylase [Desulfovibrio sp.]|nr:orotidine-5'-phosphate decarboxylase [Desulfovibrio sp.]
MASLIVALDTPYPDKALNLASSLSGIVDWFKVGLELFISAGPDIVRELKKRDFRVFLDLKFYDIPHTVEGAVRAALKYGADMMTIHCQGGARMCEAARRVIVEQASPCLLIGVTALTSFARGEMPGIDLPPSEFALSLARDAWKWGLDGVVCSGREAAAIKTCLPAFIRVCPGVRLEPAADDQRRSVTPREAVEAGADYIVVGRPVCEADDAAKAAARIRDAMNGNL